jgi:hypothetical protein
MRHSRTGPVSTSPTSSRQICDRYHCRQREEGLNQHGDSLRMESCPGWRDPWIWELEMLAGVRIEAPQL